jgi:hypothetical protein
MPCILLIIRGLVPVGHEEKALDKQKAVIFIVEIIQELIACKYSEKNSSGRVLFCSYPCFREECSPSCLSGGIAGLFQYLVTHKRGSAEHNSLIQKQTGPSARPIAGVHDAKEVMEI